MDERGYKTLRNVLIAGTVLGSAIADFSFDYMKTEVETKAERTKAVQELINSEGFQKYMAARKELADKLTSDPSVSRTMHITSIVESTFGEFEPGSFEIE